MSGAQNQHYVPKFILRQFLVDGRKEQVSVYDKHTDKVFNTSVRNIMAERRFNDFSYEEFIVSFEQIASRIEDMILPTYQRIIQNRRLDRTPQENADLAFLVAFQFLRTKATRQMYQDLEMLLQNKIEEMGHQMSDIRGWEPQTEDRVKQQNLIHIKDSLPKFAHILAQKDFLLASCPSGRSFYLGDNPVCLNNRKTFGAYGNLGFGVTGIEIYLPLSSDLILCAWCPSIIEEVRAGVAIKRNTKSQASIAYLLGKISREQMTSISEQIMTQPSTAEETLDAFEAGVPINSNAENMDFYNSMQAATAHRYIISQTADFELAKRHNKEFPDLRRGRKLRGQ